MDQRPHLSIIIPCYNCEKTLAEAVDSCFTQGLEQMGTSFEIVLVDDGSSDSTRTTIKRIADEAAARGQKNIRYFFHEKNQGGGAARNTAVEKSNADIIFCLDSDDVLPENTLANMFSYFSEKIKIGKKCDGVAFSGAYSFSKKKEDHTVTDFKLPPDQPILLDYLFSGRAWVGGNFMYSKAAFLKAGGYPSDHPFDTQGYGFRFLAAGLIAYPCPGTFLYQRQFAEQESYFERAYRSGEFSVGHYINFREYVEIFSKKVQGLVLNYDIFTKNTFESNILKDMQTSYAADSAGFFEKNITAARTATRNNPEYLYQQSQFTEALAAFRSQPITYANAPFDFTRYAYGAEHGAKMTLAAYRKAATLDPIATHKTNLLRPSFFYRLRRKIKKVLHL